MQQVQVTRVSSKGQVVIPTDIRKKLGISNGTHMVIFTDGDNLLLKPVQAPQFEAFKKLITESRKVIKKSGFTKSNLSDLIKKVRNENRT